MSESTTNPTTVTAEEPAEDPETTDDYTVRIRDMTKIFEESDGSEVVAVDDLSIDIRPGEFLVLVGPSGCGKTTTLRSVAGLEEPTEGSIEIEGRDVVGLEPRERNISMVFQNYALYPHKTVRENISFPLEVRKFPKDEKERRVQETAELLDIPELLDRKPGALSGGQQQRVALGRAIVRQPAVFLMDEPLSNLDAKLRVQMRTELNELHQRVGRTTIYVTHDQAEAMTLGDRVAVMNDGRLQQIGPPQHLYDSPANRFVAGFIGEPPMNFFSVDIRQNGDYHATCGLFDFPLPEEIGHKVDAWDGSLDDVTMGIRPEDFHDVSVDEREATDHNTFEARVKVVEPMGSDKFLTLAGDAEDEEFTARVAPESSATEDETITLAANLEKVHLFDNTTGENITY